MRRTKTVLVVEDHPEERKIFSTYLQFVGGSILTAERGEEGLRLAREHIPDLILLDLRLPDLDGWEVFHRLQEDPSTRDIPVVAVTGLHLRWEELRSAGFCGYLEKPLAPHRVLEEVERCLGGRLGSEPPPETSPALVDRLGLLTAPWQSTRR